MNEKYFLSQFFVSSRFIFCFILTFLLITVSNMITCLDIAHIITLFLLITDTFLVVIFQQFESTHFFMSIINY